jgi:hypothetical protein
MLNTFIIYLLDSGLLVLFVTGVLGASILLGGFFGKRLRQQTGQQAVSTDELTINAILGLMSLVVAFTFSGAYQRFDYRTGLIIEEYNAISTSYAFVSTLPESRQARVREDYRRVLDQRISMYQKTDRQELDRRANDLEQSLQVLWNDAVSAVRATPYPDKLISGQILLTITEMGDALERRKHASKQHPPAIIYSLLFLLIAIGAFITGYSNAVANRHAVTFVSMYILLMAAVFCITVNLEHPLHGMITLDDFTRQLTQLRALME